jgi:hypothetical protein
MKAHALVPALLLAGALLAPPVADAADRHRSDRGRRPPAHGYYSHRPSHRPSYGYHYRAPRPYYRPYRYYSVPYGYYGYGYGYGYGAYGYGYGYYPPPPPPRCCPPRPRVGFWFGF